MPKQSGISGLQPPMTMVSKGRMGITPIWFACLMQLLIVPTAVAQGVTDGECRKFAARISAAVEAGDYQACSKLFSTQAHVDTLFDGIEFKYREHQAVRDHWLRRIENMQMLYAGLVWSVQGTGSYRLVKVRRTSPRQLVMRFLMEDDTLDYHFLTVQRGQSKELEVVDTNLLSYGGSFFSSVRVLLERFMVYEGDDGKIVRDLPHAKELIRQKSLLAEIRKRFEADEFRDALYFYSLLPKELREQKIALRYAIPSAIGIALDAETNEQVQSRESVEVYFNMYKRLYPDDPAVDLHGINYYTATEQFEKALACIDRVDDFVGGDPYLYLLRARIHAAKGNDAKAILLTELARREVDDLPEIRIELASLVARQDDFERVVEILEELATRFDFEFEEFSVEGDAWNRFFESEQYKQWSSRRTEMEARKTSPRHE